MLKLAVKHCIKELAIDTLFDKVSSHFGNPINNQIIRSDEIEVKHLGFIKHYYDSSNILSEGMQDPFDRTCVIYAMSLYSIYTIAHENNLSVDSARKTYGAFKYFVKIYLRRSDKKIVSFYSTVLQDQWIVK